MRHFVANVVTYVIALLLLSGAGVFAWVRSAKVVFTSERAVLEQYRPAPGEPFRWEEVGAGSYARNCENCHTADGRGWDQYPGMALVPVLFAAEGGREYLIDLHLYGSDGPRWRVPMPPMGHLEDVEMAAVINYVVTAFGDARALDGVALVTPEEVAARRGQRLSPGAVEERRPRLR